MLMKHVMPYAWMALTTTGMVPSRTNNSNHVTHHDRPAIIPRSVSYGSVWKAFHHHPAPEENVARLRLILPIARPAESGCTRAYQSSSGRSHRRQSSGWLCKHREGSGPCVNDPGQTPKQGWLMVVPITMYSRQTQHIFSWHCSYQYAAM